MGAGWEVDRVPASGMTPRALRAAEEKVAGWGVTVWEEALSFRVEVSLLPPAPWELLLLWLLSQLRPQKLIMIFR